MAVARLGVATRAALRRAASARRPRRGACSAARADATLAEAVAAKNAEEAVLVYSKSWCPYCSQVKSLFAEVGVEPTVVELDKLVEEKEVQQVLQDLTGQRTVPNVFIGGTHVGGCDDTYAAHRSGKLAELLAAAGVETK